jgi:hypothetical protein
MLENKVRSPSRDETNSVGDDAVLTQAADFE